MELPAIVPQTHHGHLPGALHRQLRYLQGSRLTCTSKKKRRSGFSLWPAVTSQGREHSGPQTQGLGPLHPPLSHRRTCFPAGPESPAWKFRRQGQAYSPWCRQPASGGPESPTSTQPQQGQCEVFSQRALLPKGWRHFLWPISTSVPWLSWEEPWPLLAPPAQIGH